MNDNVIKFRKPPPPKKPKKPLRIQPWVIVIAGALALGAVAYVMDQGKAASVAPRAIGP